MIEFVHKMESRPPENGKSRLYHYHTGRPENDGFRGVLLCKKFRFFETAERHQVIDPHADPHG